MPYVILKSCVAGGESRSAGDVIELGGDEARSLLAMGRVSVAPDVKPVQETNRSVGLEADAASPVKKRGRK